MAKLSYPTTEDLENFLKLFYSPKSVCLSSSQKILGNVMGQFSGNDPNQYGTIFKNVNSLTGIDIPVLVTDNNSASKTIAIVAQDPWRSAKDNMLKGLMQNQPIIGTPFALHYDENVYPQTKVYRNIIEKILNLNFKVYITDARKIYPQKKT